MWVIRLLKGDPVDASRYLQNSLNNINNRLCRWRIKANKSKSVQVTFTNRKLTFPPITINGMIHTPTWRSKVLGHPLRSPTNMKNSHIFQTHLDLRLRDMFWLLNQNPNKILVYKCVLNPIWTYIIQFWGMTSDSNIDVLQRFQSKYLQMVTNAPNIQLDIIWVKHEITKEWGSQTTYRHQNNYCMASIEALWKKNWWTKFTKKEQPNHRILSNVGQIAVLNKEI